MYIYTRIYICTHMKKHVCVNIYIYIYMIGKRNDISIIMYTCMYVNMHLDVHLCWQRCRKVLLICSCTQGSRGTRRSSPQEARRTLKWNVSVFLQCFVAQQGSHEMAQCCPNDAKGRCSIIQGSPMQAQRMPSGMPRVPPTHPKNQFPIISVANIMMRWHLGFFWWQRKQENFVFAHSLPAVILPTTPKTEWRRKSSFLQSQNALWKTPH